MYLEEIVYDPDKGHDVVHKLPFGFDPSQYKTKAGAAKGLYEALRKKAAEYGQNPDTEVFIQTPEQSAAAGYGRNWRVCWEAGPYEWAIGASCQIHGPWGYTEPYYSFDLCFTS